MIKPIISFFIDLFHLLINIAICCLLKIKRLCEKHHTASSQEALPKHLWQVIAASDASGRVAARLRCVSWSMYREMMTLPSPCQSRARAITLALHQNQSDKCDQVVLLPVNSPLNRPVCLGGISDPNIRDLLDQEGYGCRSNPFEVYADRNNRDLIGFIKRIQRADRFQAFRSIIIQDLEPGTFYRIKMDFASMTERVEKVAFSTILGTNNYVTCPC